MTQLTVTSHVRLPASAEWFVALFLSGAAAVSMAADSVQPSEVPAKVGFNDHIRPILVKNCVGCHGGPKQAAGVTFLHRDSALSESESGVAPIVPGDPDASYLVDRISEPDDDLRMPPADHGPRLTERQVELIRKWIEQGAHWEEAWSLVAPAAAPAPEVELDVWPRRGVDRFILRRLEAEGLRPSPAADRMQWLRRVTLDLTGLPPTEQEMSDFAVDNRPDAYERVVDRLLALPRFGERWASLWLDLARYADTMGFEKDLNRDIWPYRDWLIRALNADMPYDEFTVKQLAGDLLPGATIDDRIATAMHRNTQNNTEGGTDDEEFRTVAVLDRVNTTWQVWMATTYGCAQCHAHPYDALKHEDYYRFAAFFNTSRDCDVGEDLPRLDVPLDRGDFERAGEIDREIAALRRQLHEPLRTLAEDEGQWLRAPLSHAESTGSAELSIVEGEGGAELIAGGTISSSSMYVVKSPSPTSEPITALRIDALPRDIESARKNGEIGFAVTRLRLHVAQSKQGAQSEQGAQPGEALREVEFSLAFCDEPAPDFDAQESLNDSFNGWSAYSRMFAPRWAVFVLDKPLTVPEDAQLRLTLLHARNLDGQGALALRRARFSVSTDDQWTGIAERDEHAERADRLAELRAERESIESISIPVMAERAEGHKRRTFVFDRGNWLDKGAEVQPGTPSSMPPLENRDGGLADRLDMARWIASRDNPLTGRAMVNRVWAQLFGVGIVETEEDFGAAGEPPSHPELLDYLAVKFVDDWRWSLKKLLRELTLSATYRQDARVGRDLVHRDPRNRLLARGPRQRLTAEMVRDQALLVSGRLSPKMFGKPVMPFQPDGIWESVYSNQKWTNATGEDRYRRAVYTYWKRTSAYPSMMSFDTPSREVCTVRRITTNTPLQALVTMNDPAYTDLAQGFAERIAKEGGAELTSRLTWAYRTATGKRPHAVTLAELERLHGDAIEHFAADKENCRELADTPELFALTVVANAVLNLDAALTR